MTTGRPVGRPRTTTADLPDDWENIMREAAQEGASDVEVRCLLGIGESGWYTLIEDDEQFCRTVKECKSLCQVWWERTGRKMTMGADGNATVWIFNMKNRFGWHDKQQVDNISSDGSMSPKESSAAVLDALKRKHAPQ